MSEPPEPRDRMDLTREDVRSIVRAVELQAEVSFRQIHAQLETSKLNVNYAHQALDVQARDRISSRKYKFWSYVLGLASLVGFLVFAMNSGNQEIAFEILKIGGAVAVGAVGGAGYMRSKATARE